MVVGLVPERGGQVAGDMFEALGAVRTRSICVGHDLEHLWP